MKPPNRPGIAGSSQRLVASVVETTRNPLTSLRLTSGEILLSAALFTALALAIYLPHIVNGGWYIDDWIVLARMHESSGLLDAFNSMRAETFRPGLALTLSVLYEIGGTGHAGYLTIGALLAAIQGWLFYLVLRILRLRIAVASIVAAIFVVLPVIDATRLWLSAFPTQVAGILYLLGVVIALYGMAHANGRRAVAWHAGAATLYFAAILTYELISGLVAVTALLYIVRSGWRPAPRRWLADLASIALALAILIPRGAADREAHTSLSFIWERVSGTLTQAEVVFRWLLPVHGVLGGPVGVVLLVVGMLGAGIAIGRGGETGRGLASWAKIAGLSTVFSLAGLAMLLPADPYFVPRISGMGDRTGAFAAFGAVPLLVALIVLTLGGLGTLLRRPRIGFGLAAALVLLTGLNLAGRELRQQDPWADSWRQQNEVLADIDSAMGGRIPANSALISFGHTTFIEPADVSVFAYGWDLRGALWEIYKRPKVEAHPWAAEARCEPAGVVFPEEEVTPGAAYPFGYRKLFFVNAATRTARRIRDQAECETTGAAMTGQPAA